MLRIAVLFAQKAVLFSVDEINGKSDGEPNEEADPGVQRQRKHHEQASNNSQNRNQWNPWRFEWTLGIGLLVTQYQDAQTHHYKGEQRTDTRHFPYNTDGYKTGKQADKGTQNHI